MKYSTGVRSHWCEAALQWRRRAFMPRRSRADEQGKHGLEDRISTAISRAATPTNAFGAECLRGDDSERRMPAAVLEKRLRVKTCSDTWRERQLWPVYHQIMSFANSMCNLALFA